MKRTLVAAVLLVVSALVAAQPYPSKPIRLIVGFPPGGSADPTTRIIGAALQEQMGQPVVVENRPGADSAIAAEQVSKMAPDGYTIMFASNSGMTAAVALRKTPPYDPLKDFTPVSMVGRATVFFYVHPSIPARTMKEFVDYAKANPGKVVYGTGNPLSILYGQQLVNATGIHWLHVPYKGEGPLNPDILAGRVHCSFRARAARCRMPRTAACVPSRYCSAAAARCYPTSRPSTRPACRRSRYGSGPASSARRRCRARWSSA